MKSREPNGNEKTSGEHYEVPPSLSAYPARTQRLCELKRQQGHAGPMTVHVVRILSSRRPSPEVQGHRELS